MAITDLKITNMAVSALAGNLTDVATSFSVEAGDGNLKFPTITGSQYFHIVVVNASDEYEIMKVTARSSDNFTVTRAQQGTTAMAFSTGDAVAMRMTATDFQDVIDFLATCAVEGGTVAALTVSTTLTASGDLDIAGASIDLIPAGMEIMMFQTSIPTGWTLQTADDDKAPIIRDDNAVAGGTGGSWTISGISVNNTTLTAAQSGLPSHTHTVAVASTGSGANREATGDGSDSLNTGSTGGTSASSGHNHALTIGRSWRPAYVYCWRGIRS